MRDDLHLTFGEIFHNDRSAFLKQLIDIQHHKAKREASEKWAEQLRFIDISNVPSLSNSRAHFGHLPQLILPLTEQHEDNGSRYVAISWRWAGGNDLPPWGCETRTSFDYRIQRSGRQPHKSKFPSQYLERAILFAQEKKIDKLWVDIECIYQEPGDGDADKKLGVQIMDIVYGDSDLAVGLLTTGLIYQKEVALLAELLSGHAFVDFANTETPQLRSDVGHLELQTLILRILSDSRWSRGWIFQEDHLASGRMTLLIPHSSNVVTKNLPYNFGKIPGNLQMKVPAFRKAVTMFCLANEDSELRWPNTEILAKAKQYNIWNLEKYETAPVYRTKHRMRLRIETDHPSIFKRYAKVEHFNELVYPSTTSSVLEDICHRDLSNKEDRIAIMANAARFPTRLDCSPASSLVKSEHYSLSAVLLTLVLLNGEILNQDIEYGIDDIMTHTVCSYLEKNQYKFNAPLLRYQQSWIDHCRFKASTLRINDRGVEVQGHLFALLPKLWPYSEKSKPNPLKLSRLEIDDLHHLAQNPEVRQVARSRVLDKSAAKIIVLIISKLRTAYGMNSALAQLLDRHLDLDATPPPDHEKELSTSYILGMMAGLVKAIQDGREVRLARLEGEPPTTPPSAIFIAPLHHEGWVGECASKQYGENFTHGYVFTSWDNGVRSTRVGSHSMEQLASLEVVPDHRDRFACVNRQDPKQADNMRLRSCGWANGVWVTKGKPMGKYIFPIPGLTEPRPSSMRDPRKRKRESAGEDGDDTSSSIEEGRRRRDQK